MVNTYLVVRKINVYFSQNTSQNEAIISLVTVSLSKFIRDVTLGSAANYVVKIGSTLIVFSKRKTRVPNHKYKRTSLIYVI